MFAVWPIRINLIKCHLLPSVDKNDADHLDLEDDDDDDDDDDEDDVGDGNNVVVDDVDDEFLDNTDDDVEAEELLPNIENFELECWLLSLLVCFVAVLNGDGEELWIVVDDRNFLLFDR